MRPPALVPPVRRLLAHKPLARTVIPLLAVVCLLAAGAAVYAQSQQPAASAAKKRTRAFTVKSRFATDIRPGTTSQIWLRFGNRTKQTIWITKLSFKLSIDGQHAAAGCSVKRDFALLQLPKTAFPIKVTKPRKSKAKRKPRWLTPRMLRVNARPALQMLNLDHTNQDACKRADLKLTFSGTATDRKPKRWRSTVRSSQAGHAGGAAR